MAKQSSIKLFNGRFKDRSHIYIAAYSKADAARILQQAYDTSRSQIHEINEYFSKGCWGNRMEGIKPERGAWVTLEHNDNPKRII